MVGMVVDVEVVVVMALLAPLAVAAVAVEDDEACSWGTGEEEVEESAEVGRCVSARVVVLDVDGEENEVEPEAELERRGEFNGESAWELSES